MSGYEVSKRLRADAGFDATVMVAMTGYGQDEDKQQSRESGFDHHFVKPVDPDVLKDLLDSIEPK